MAKQLTPRKRLNALFPFLHSLLTTAEPAPSPRSKRLARRIERVLKRPLERAFEKAKLNVDNQGDRDQLLVWLAWAVYGGKSAGAPRKWTPKKQQLLLTDVRALQARDPKLKLKETECCDLLSKGKAAEGRYKGFESETLRRVLQNAKRLDRKAKALATPLKDVIATSKSAGEKPS
jgi:hypothetical protein